MLKLREIRKSKGLSVPELSRQSGVPKRTDCRISTAFALCKAMQIPLDEIYEPDPEAE